MTAPIWETEVIPLPWTHAGFDCAIVRNDHMLNLCGYVRFPEGHPLYGVDYGDPVPAVLKLAAEAAGDGPIGKRGMIDVFLLAAGGDMRAGMLFDVHGGITFSCLDSYWLPPGFWYGFDCGHAGDMSPGLTKLFDTNLFDDDVYRDVAYVKAECESLAVQVAQLLVLCQ